MTEVGSSGQPPPGFHDFLLQLAGPVAVHSTLTVSASAAWGEHLLFPAKRLQMATDSALVRLQSGLDIRDAAVNSLLGDVAALLHVLAKQVGDPLREHLARSVLPPLSLPRNLQARQSSFCAPRELDVADSCAHCKRRCRTTFCGGSSPRTPRA